MRILLMASLITAASVAFAQTESQKAPQQRPPAAQETPPAAQEQAKAKDAEERLRADGAAGGTRPVPEEKRKSVGAGAGPHRHDHLPSPAKLPRDEPVEPAK